MKLSFLSSNILEQTRNLLEEAKKFIESSPWKGELSSSINKLLYDVDKKCELAIFGSVKAGKSTFINTILGEDLAVVGVTEATATINYFKYADKPEEIDRVSVVYSDGHLEWKDKSFLDSLQGNTQEVLQRSKEIDHLELFLKNDILKNITIIDTPGTHSVVEHHTKQTEDYISSEQAERNMRESIRLKNKADAVIILLGHVKKAKDLEDVKRFTDSSTPFNSLGVISKIDISENDSIDDWRKRCKAHQEAFINRLHSTHPVSAELYRTITKFKDSDELKWLHRKVNNLHEKTLLEGIINLISEDRNSLKSEDLVALRLNEKDEESLSKLSFSHEVRTRILKMLPVPTIRNIILRHLYKQDFASAISSILEHSGFENISQIINKQFFKRSYAIRCYSILRKLYLQLEFLEKSRLTELTNLSRYKKYYLKIIDEYSGILGRFTSENERIIASFRSMVENHTFSLEEINRYKVSITSLQKKALQVITTIEGENNNSEAMLLLENNRAKFTIEEIEELELLFGKFPERNKVLLTYDIGQRYAYWNNKVERSMNENIKSICEFARKAWSRLKLS